MNENTDPWEIIISDPTDRKEPVAEIWYKNKYWVEISAETPYEFVIQFYNNNSESFWEFSYEEAIGILEDTKEHLNKLQRTPEAQAEYDAMKKEQENWKPTPEETAEYERKMEEQRKKYYS
jgi:hypothetical protein